MTAMWFGLAAIALVGAVVLLYFDRVQRQRTGHARQVWAKSQGYTYVSVEPALASTWRRGALAKLGYLSAVDVVSGIRKGEKFVLFDLEDAATLVAVRRQIGSEIDVDMRLKTASPPKDHDLELLGAIGDRVVFATDPDIARHAVDQRMVGFIESLSDTVQMLWSEGNWTLGMLPVGSAAKDWETAIDAVLRLSGLLHVLPPVAEPNEYTRPRSGMGEPSAEDFRDEYDDYTPAARVPDADGRARFPGPDDDDVDDHYGRAAEPLFPTPPTPAADDEYDRRAPRKPSFAADPDFDPDLDDPDFEDQPAPGRRPLGEPPKRPSLAVVPEPRPRVEPPRPRVEEPRPRTEEPRDDDSDQPGGPFHPGFRPYQGPVPK
ncbi:hypothetical protein [Nocardia caishijiensis]|uniref:Secreted protein n=1 Tax=Nocardia caishijiensis TaxID=184756 RepID=A0ABQ6YTS8_9NOCA|nr:hypothetical protein [Nocardia caishijiensis]KAF0849209.1 hypothetical protein FNL39_101646 [Nocardia caishijiensis]